MLGCDSAVCVGSIPEGAAMISVLVPSVVINFELTVDGRIRYPANLNVIYQPLPGIS